MREADDAPASVYRRCPFYKPGDLYRCEGTDGHEGAHYAEPRANAPSVAGTGTLRWTAYWRPPEIPEEVVMRFRRDFWMSDWAKIETSTLRRERILARGEAVIAEAVS